MNLITLIFKEKSTEVAAAVMKSVLKNAERKPFPVESITSIAGAIEGKTLLYAVQSHAFLINRN